MSGIDRPKSGSKIAIPNDPRILKFILKTNRIKILKCLMELELELGKKAYQEFHNPGPYLSLIHKRCGLNKRTTLINLNDMGRGGLVTSTLLQCEIGGRQQLVRVFKLNPELDFSWLKDIHI